VDHNEVTGVCSSCHNGTIATGKTADHIPTTAQCDDCHSTGQWTPAAVDHAAFSGNCISCHDGVAASGKSATHIASNDVCDACHQKFPAAWTPINPSAVDHNEVTGACFDCHNGTVASGKSATHISTSDKCDACHQPGPAPWTPVASSAVDHNEVTGVCSSCHNGTIATGKTADHIVTTEECDVCHSTGAWIPAGVDHTAFSGNCISCHDGVTASGKSAAHIASSNVCDACHQKLPANWIPVSPSAVDHNEVTGVCFDCHNGTVANGKSVTHISTTNTCDACHNTAGWTPVVVVDHNQVVAGSCVDCHDGTIASGKSLAHMATSNRCDACHQPEPAKWVPVTSNAVDHNEVMGACSSCHDGVIASGKSSGHIPTTQECSGCHSTNAWVPATIVDHSTFVGNCISCHDGVAASGKSATHIASSNVCDACHQTFPATWVPVSPSAVDHNEVLGDCSTCHDGTIAVGKSATHILTSLECDSCHSTTAWVPTFIVDHSAFVGNCISCHDGVSARGKGATHIPSSNICDACHQVFPTPWVPLAPSAVDHNEVVGVCFDCHNGTVVGGKPPTHLPTSNVCDACHSTATWSPAITVDHAEVLAGSCVDCHNGTLASGKTPTHILSSNICDACHQPAPAKWAPVAPNAVDHNEVTGVCSSCHNGVVALGKSANHISSSNVCDACHNTQAWAPVTTVDHNEVNGSCSTCHNGTDATGPGSGHFQYSNGLECDACHTTNSWVNVDYAHIVYYPGDHAAFNSQNCNRCHANSETVRQSAYSTYPMTCAGCHANDYSPGDHDNTPLATAVDCASSNCHKSTPEHRVTDANWD